MKIKNKGKVHPSPSSSSSSSSSSPSDGFVLSVLQLLPAAILASVSVLSTQDKEVLAYLITRSMKTAPNTTQDSNKKPPKKRTSSKSNNNNNNNVNSRHKPPMFDCECFDCYRSYWFKWNSSPDRHLIHEAIEAFEDHLAHSERPKKSPGGRGKKRDKMGRREAQKPVNITPKDQVFPAPENVEASAVVPEVLALTPPPPPPCDVVSVSSPPKAEVAVEDGEVDEQAPEEDMALVVRAAAASNHRGLVRKVLPDVLGLFNSRLWNLWSPNA